MGLVTQEVGFGKRLNIGINERGGLAKDFGKGRTSRTVKTSSPSQLGVRSCGPSIVLTRRPRMFIPSITLIASSRRRFVGIHNRTFAQWPTDRPRPVDN